MPESLNQKLNNVIQNDEDWIYQHLQTTQRVKE